MTYRFGGGLLVLALFATSDATAQPRQIDPCAGARDVRLVNGKIVTMDAQNSIVSEATIQDGRFVAVGRRADRTSPCTREIDLRGRTAVPGLRPVLMALPGPMSEPDGYRSSDPASSSLRYRCLRYRHRTHIPSDLSSTVRPNRGRRTQE